MLEDIEKMNDSVVNSSDRGTFGGQANHNSFNGSAQYVPVAELNEIKSNLNDKIRKLKELDQILMEQSQKYD